MSHKLSIGMTAEQLFFVSYFFPQPFSLTWFSGGWKYPNVGRLYDGIYIEAMLINVSRN